MAQKELDSFIASLKDIGASFDDIRKTKDEVAQRDLRKQLLSQLPGQLQEAGYTPGEAGFVGNATALDSKAGIGLVGDLIKSRAAARKDATKDTPQTADQLKNIYGSDYPDSFYQAVGQQKTKSEQDKAFANKNNRLNADAKESSTLSGEARRTRVVEYTQPYNAFYKDLTGETKAYDADSNKARNALKLLSLEKLPADSAVVNHMARVVGGEKGPLSDADRAAFLSRTLNTSSEKAMNFLTSGDTTLLTPEQRQTYATILKQSVENTDNYKTQRASEAISLFKQAHPKYSTDESGKLEEGLAGLAKAYGLTHDPQTGKITSPTIETKLTGTYAKAFQAADKIADPAKKAMIQKLVTESAKTGAQIPPERLKQLGVE